MSHIEKLGISKWRSKEVAYQEYKVVDENDDLISIAGSGYSDYLYHDKSDAQLIAAAPEMLERVMIEALVNDHSLEDVQNNPYYEMALVKHKTWLSIIEKATGKTWEQIKELLK